MHAPHASTYDGRFRGPCLLCSHPMTRLDVKRRRTLVLPCEHRFHDACVRSAFPPLSEADCPACAAPFVVHEEEDAYELRDSIKDAYYRRPPRAGGEVEVELVELDARLAKNRRTALRIALRRGTGRAVHAVFQVILVNDRHMATLWPGAAERAVAVQPRNWSATARASTDTVRRLLARVLPDDR